jgi:hypothetical protein
LNDKILFVDTEINFSSSYFLKTIRKILKEKENKEGKESNLKEKEILDCFFYYRITSQMEMNDFLEKDFLNLIKQEKVINSNMKIIL